ncbi:MAG TPA: argininosuccinate lyase [Acidobacteriota bacterium]|nr:argininosuccinate lyase [Acidobacteriota bacterium]
MKFAAAYIDNILAENFRDARRLFFQSLLDIHYAHLTMLHRTNIIPATACSSLIRALDSIQIEDLVAVAYDGTFEDLFFYVERLLAERTDPDTAGMLHVARSRNDVDVTLYRLRWRESVVEVMGEWLALREVLLDIAERETETILPMHTHTQPAQPSTVAHYLHSFIEHLERDHLRLSGALKQINQCPLGSCAITGTGFPIDREMVSDLLAFDRPTGNTYGSIASSDYLLETAGTLMTFLVDFGRLVHDLLLWSTAEFQYVRLSDGFVQPSSIMPQKRNPVALEHSRALISIALGESQTVFQTLHNTPYGDIVDIEDDIQPVVFRMFRDVLRSVRLVRSALESIEFNRARMLEDSRKSWITMTELADTLTRREKLPFRSAHRIASKMVQELIASPAKTLNDVFRKASEEVIGKALDYGDDELRAILDPVGFIGVRRHLGGPAPATVRGALAESTEHLKKDRSDHQTIQEKLRNFRYTLRDQARKCKQPGNSGTDT